ncbi:MAG TPA: pilus assembly protein TadG-related protein [Terriglobia bacterium]|nr:pilus assembly protein TadG-related protein [Terriglobia bacterium]
MKDRQHPGRDSRNGDQGFVLVAVALVLVALLGVVALAVDTGVLYGARTATQEIADAAAMAAAFTFTNTPTAPQPATATNHALGVALNNAVMGQALSAGDVTVTPDLANRRVTVSIRTRQRTYFARAIGMGSVDIAATATAESARYATGSACVKPWFLPNVALSGGAVCTDECNAARLLIDPVAKEVTTFGMSMIGKQFTVKPQDPAQALSPGNFYAIQFPDSRGAAGYRDDIATCQSPYIRCGDRVSVKTGNMVGPTVQGVHLLIGNPSRFSWVGPGQYERKADGKILDISENVILVPIWSSCGSNFCPSAQIKSGELVVVGYAAIFLEGMSGDYVVARLLGISSCGPLVAPTVTGGSTLSIPLRLVHP